MNKYALAALMFSVFVVCGCASESVEYNHLNIPLVDLQTAAHLDMPIRSRRVSTNGREFYSDYFKIGRNGRFQQAENDTVRYQARAKILGDERPYDLIIMVAVEERDSSGNYATVRYDKAMAMVILRRIQKTLHERREHHGNIDDFRAF